MMSTIGAAPASVSAGAAQQSAEKAQGRASRRRWRATSESHAFREEQRREWQEPESPINMERVMGIEPTLVAWEATVLPLNYTRLAVRNSRRPRRGTATGP